LVLLSCIFKKHWMIAVKYWLEEGLGENTLGLLIFEQESEFYHFLGLISCFVRLRYSHYGLCICQFGMFVIELVNLLSLFMWNLYDTVAFMQYHQCISVLYAFLLSTFSVFWPLQLGSLSSLSLSIRPVFFCGCSIPLFTLW
jgi:hypothetical protein